MAQEENLCDRTYRAHERQESKPDKPETRSLPRHTKQDHKNLQSCNTYLPIKVVDIYQATKRQALECNPQDTLNTWCSILNTRKESMIYTSELQAPGTQFLYSQLGRVVIKKHTYLTPVTHATYPWNYTQPPGRKSAFKMPKTVYPKK